MVGKFRRIRSTVSRYRRGRDIFRDNALYNRRLTAVSVSRNATSDDKLSGKW